MIDDCTDSRYDVLQLVFIRFLLLLFLYVMVRFPHIKQITRDLCQHTIPRSQDIGPLVMPPTCNFALDLFYDLDSRSDNYKTSLFGPWGSDSRAPSRYGTMDSEHFDDFVKQFARYCSLDCRASRAFAFQKLAQDSWKKEQENVEKRKEAFPKAET